MMKDMDLSQEGPLSSEDRLFLAGGGRQPAQPNAVNPFGAVRWEGGRPVYSPFGQVVRRDVG